MLFPRRKHENLIFQQDDAPAHNTKTVQKVVCRQDNKNYILAMSEFKFNFQRGYIGSYSAQKGLKEVCKCKSSLGSFQAFVLQY